jgi:cytoskeletal protein RodZ
MFFSKQKKTKEEIKKNPLQNPKILEVNLIRDEVRIGFDWGRNISVLLLVLFIAGLLVAEVYYGLTWWEQQENLKSQALADEISKVNQEISQIKNKSDEALSYKDKSNELGDLLSKHIYWTTFFSWLEQNTLNTVSYGSFSGDTTGVYSLSAKALNYAQVSWQVKAFSDSPLVKKVEVLGVTSASAKDKNQQAIASGVNFSMDLEVDPIIFRK